MNHGADAGIGQQLQQQRMRRRTVDDVGPEHASGKRVDSRTKLGDHALIDLAAVEHLIDLVERQVGDK
jgi:hypothetical protein